MRSTISWAMRVTARRTSSASMTWAPGNENAPVRGRRSAFSFGQSGWLLRPCGPLGTGVNGLEAVYRTARRLRPAYPADADGDLERSVGASHGGEAAAGGHPLGDDRRPGDDLQGEEGGRRRPVGVLAGGDPGQGRGRRLGQAPRGARADPSRSTTKGSDGRHGDLAAVVGLRHRRRPAPGRRRSRSATSSIADDHDHRRRAAAASRATTAGRQHALRRGVGLDGARPRLDRPVDAVVVSRSGGDGDGSTDAPGRDGGQHAVDEAAGVVGGVALGQLDGLGDDRPGGDVGPVQPARRRPCRSRARSRAGMRSRVQSRAKRPISSSTSSWCSPTPGTRSTANGSGSTGSSASTSAGVTPLVSASYSSDRARSRAWRRLAASARTTVDRPRPG